MIFASNNSSAKINLFRQIDTKVMGILAVDTTIATDFADANHRDFVNVCEVSFSNQSNSTRTINLLTMSLPN